MDNFKFEEKEFDLNGLFKSEGTVSFSGEFPKNDFDIKPGDKVKLYLGPEEHFECHVGSVKEKNTMRIDDNFCAINFSFSPAGKVKYVSHNEAVIARLGRGRIF